MSLSVSSKLALAIFCVTAFKKHFSLGTLMSLVRKLTIAAVATCAALTQACSFDGDRKFRELAEVYQMHLENRAVSERLREFSYASHDPFLYDTVVRDGQDADAGYDKENEHVRKAAKDALRMVGRAGVKALEHVVKGGGAVGEVLVENPNFEDSNFELNVNEPYSIPLDAKKERTKRLIAPKISPGTKHFRAGLDFGDWVSLRYKAEYDLEDAELQVKARMRMFHDFYLTGVYERELTDRTNTYGGGAFWWKFGATYSKDDTGHDAVMLEFNTSR